MNIIWLPKKYFPNNQHTKISQRMGDNNTYTVARFSKLFKFDKNVKSINIKAAADTVFYLYCNSNLVINSGMKPAVDFWQWNYKLDSYYWAKNTINFDKKTNEIEIVAFVQLFPSVESDFSSEDGGFAFDSEVIFEDGCKENIVSDNTWNVVLDSRFDKAGSFDNSLGFSKTYKGEIRKFKWKFIDPGMKCTIEEPILQNGKIIVGPHKKKKVIFDFDKIYSSFVEVKCDCEGLVKGKVDCFETKIFNTGFLDFSFVKSDKVRYFDLKSIGRVVVTIENKSNSEATIELNVNFTHYDYGKMGYFNSGNLKLDDLMEKCKFCGVNCSQSYYLDSPKHQEPFASCSGDYQIISLVEGFASGDYALAKHALEGYFRAMDLKKGYAVNSNYALVSINWLWQIYMITGDKNLLFTCLKGVKSVINLYSSYVGNRGFIDHPDNYIFMDWLEIDGYNLYGPPAALGQTVLNMYYCHALESISKIYNALDDLNNSKKFEKKFKKTKRVINKYFFDKERGLYFEGLNEPLPKDYKPVIACHAIPENTSKRYFMKHSNVLAVAFGIAKPSKQKKIVRKIFGELKDCQIQPYFSHYTYQAIHNAGLDSKFAMKQTKEWLAHVKIKDKGLPEGFYKPSPTYSFDYSHAWACSPYYSLITAASGIQISEPGMRKIKLNPSTLGLEKLDYKIGTPYGFISIVQEKGKPAEIVVPKEITVEA